MDLGRKPTDNENGIYELTEEAIIKENHSPRPSLRQRTVLDLKRMSMMNNIRSTKHFKQEWDEAENEAEVEAEGESENFQILPGNQLSLASERKMLADVPEMPDEDDGVSQALKNNLPKTSSNPLNKHNEDLRIGDEEESENNLPQAGFLFPPIKKLSLQDRLFSNYTSHSRAENETSHRQKAGQSFQAIKSTNDDEGHIHRRQQADDALDLESLRCRIIDLEDQEHKEHRVSQECFEDDSKYVVPAEPQVSRPKRRPQLSLNASGNHLTKS